MPRPFLPCAMCCARRTSRTYVTTNDGGRIRACDACFTLYLFAGRADKTPVGRAARRRPRGGVPRPCDTCGGKRDGRHYARSNGRYFALCAYCLHKRHHAIEERIAAFGPGPMPKYLRRAVPAGVVGDRAVAQVALYGRVRA